MKIAVVGATGNVGRQILNILAERDFPATEVIALASRNSKGKQVSYGEKDILTVKWLDEYDFTGTKLVFFSAGSEVAKTYVPKATEKGCVVIDNSSYFRTFDDIPLIIPEVNPRAIEMYKNKNIIANPNCSTIQMLVALKPIHDLAIIKRIVVSTYQAVSGAGKEAMDELFRHTKKIYENEFLPPIHFKKQIPFNVIPQIDVPVEDGMYKEELKMINETNKILDKNIKVSATCVRVPIFNCHSESINVECEYPIDLDELLELYEENNSVMVLDNYKEYVYATPKECSLEDCVYVSRIRQDNSVKNGLNLWVVADNLRKGAGLNMVQIAELLIEEWNK